ncbi:hypothetical protein Bca4012_051172 [Brassica carinata]
MSPRIVYHLNPILYLVVITMSPCFHFSWGASQVVMGLEVLPYENLHSSFSLSDAIDVQMFSKI